MADNGKSNSFLDALDGIAEEENQFGTIGQFQLESGYVVLRSGVAAGGNDTFFPFDPTNADSRNEAKSKAQAKFRALAEEGVAKGRGPSTAVRLTLFKNSIKGSEKFVAALQGDIVRATLTWSENYKQIIRPALERLNIGAGRYWGRLVQVLDAEKGKYTNAAGEEKDRKEWVPAEIFANEAEAAAMVGDSEGNVLPVAEADPDIPSGWPKDQWEGTLPDMKAQYATSGDLEAVAADYGIEGDEDKAKLARALGAAVTA